MPSIITHHIFSNDVYNKLSKEEQKHIGENLIIYNTFAQSHDYLYHYFMDRKNGKKIRRLGFIGHHQKTQAYLLNIVKEIINNKLQDNKDVMSYLYGSITHYVLDVNCHPYIFYKTGSYRKQDKWTHKYKGEHSHIEKDIDAIYYERKYHKKFNRCNLNRDIIKNPVFSEELNNTIRNAYKKTYGYDNMDYYYARSIKCNKFINSLVTNDRFGLKRGIYKTIDFIFGHKAGCLASYSNHILKPRMDWLNLEHKEWNNPCKKEMKYTYSFDDLYEKSIKEALKIFKEVNKVIYDNKPIEDLKKFIPNTDYANGLDCDEDIYMNYFEY